MVGGIHLSCLDIWPVRLEKIGADSGRLGVLSSPLFLYAPLLLPGGIGSIVEGRSQCSLLAVQAAMVLGAISLPGKVGLLSLGSML